MVFYRKYRPQIIGELDSQHVRDTLFSVLSHDPSHAFLFTGPKGLGKTSTARIVAKVVNCVGREKQAKKKTGREEIEPCDTCDQCVSITNGTNLDVLEIDAASNRGIDEIRDLKDKINLAPLSAKMKVYIIDEVHMLTTEAFNALLKTLEEPPPHAMFILCTTEAHKVPATILSRCYNIAFESATEEELVRSFKRIVKAENLKIDESSLQAIAKLSEGGFRDGAKILEDLASFGEKKITRELIEEKYRVASITLLISEMLTHFEKHDTASGLQLVEKIVKQGIDMKYFITQLIHVLHGLLMEKVGISKVQSVQGKGLSTVEVRSLITLLSEAANDIKYAVLPQIPLELVLIDWEGLQGQEKAESVVTETTESTINSSGSVTVTSLRRTVGNMAKIKALYGDSSIKEIKGKPSDNIVTSKVNLLEYSADSDTKEWIDALWKSIISEMKVYNHTIAGVLRGCRISSYDRKSLIIETMYKFHKERLEEGKTREALEGILRQLTGKPVSISIVLKK